jgi:hypothetical protein
MSCPTTDEMGLQAEGRQRQAAQLIMQHSHLVPISSKRLTTTDGVSLQAKTMNGLIWWLGNLQQMPKCLADLFTPDISALIHM